MAYGWMDRATAANNAVTSRLADASEALTSTLRDANDVLARQGAAGLDLARTFGGELAVNARRAGNSTRSLIAERPLESAVIVALTGVAIGWLWRRMREPRVAVPAAARKRAASATPRRRRAAAD
jgi:hypothetical protein